MLKYKMLSISTLIVVGWPYRETLNHCVHIKFKFSKKITYKDLIKPPIFSLTFNYHQRNVIFHFMCGLLRKKDVNDCLLENAIFLTQPITQGQPLCIHIFCNVPLGLSICSNITKGKKVALVLGMMIKKRKENRFGRF